MRKFAILSETPEIYGAEHLLIERASNPEAVERLQSVIAWWEDYTARNKMEMNNNPSPGNKAGGLTTTLEKSLGAVAKSGTAPLEAVYGYAELVTAHGLVFMDTPGYDPVSATRQVAGGANILAFTTGRGSAYSCKPTPSIKLATNTPMCTQMIEDMDINCGDVLDGVSIEDKGKEIFEHILKIASGQRSKSEELGYGDAEFVPWQNRSHDVGSEDSRSTGSFDADRRAREVDPQSHTACQCHSRLCHGVRHRRRQRHVQNWAFIRAHCRRSISTGTST